MKLKSAKEIVSISSLLGAAGDEHSYRVAREQISKNRKQERQNRRKGRKTNAR